jgi:hypothetical protein
VRIPFTIEEIILFFTNQLCNELLCLKRRSITQGKDLLVCYQRDAMCIPFWVDWCIFVGGMSLIKGNAKTKFTMNISSKSLFHYTKNVDYLKNILTYGFEYRKMTEHIPCLNNSVVEQAKLPNSKMEVTHIAVCFCDIPLSVAKDHIDQYGDYCIGLKKSWAIANGVTPIRYIHKQTPDAINNIFYLIAQKYHQLKLRNENISNNLLKELIEEKIINEQAYLNSMDNVPDWCLQLIKRYEMIYQDLQNHILKQSAYYRVNEGPWKNRKTGITENRIFYNEREWRAVKRNATHLTFALEDISKIIVKEESEVNLIVDLFKNSTQNFDNTMERALVRKIYTHEELFYDI